MKGDKGVKIAEKLRDCSLLLDVRKNDLSLERIFCGYLHVVFCTYYNRVGTGYGSQPYSIPTRT